MKKKNLCNKEFKKKLENNDFYFKDFLLILQLIIYHLKITLFDYFIKKYTSFYYFLYYFIHIKYF